MARRGPAVATPSEPPRVAATPTPEGRVPVTFGSLDVLRRGNNVKEMSGQSLKDYARILGILPRDIDFLTEERLRQNCLLRLAERHAQLMED